MGVQRGTRTLRSSTQTDAGTCGARRGVQVDDRASAEARIKVLRWGPLPHTGGVFGGGIGGYARYNSQALRSSLARQVSLTLVPMTVPRFRVKLLAQLHLFFRMLSDVVTISSSLLRRRPDVLHITALYWRSIYREAYAVWFAKLLGIAVFYDIRAGTFYQFVKNAGPLSSRLTRFVVGEADAVAVQGRGLVEFVDNEFGREARWIPNCFLEEDLRDSRTASLAKPAPGEKLRLVYLGYLIPEKGVDVLLETAVQLSRSIPVQVTLIGELAPRFAETLRRFLEMQTENFTVECTGRLEFDEVLEVLSEQHIFVFLSRFFGEGHPNAANEAMAVGLPVVAGRNGFLSDVVDESCGVLVDDPRDVDEVCRVLTSLVRDWGRLRRLGDGARRRIRTTFGENQVLTETAEVYKRCARRIS